MRVLAGIVTLPVYMVASNCCLITGVFGHGCMRVGESHQACVASPQASEDERDSGTDCAGPAAQHPSDHDRSGTGRVASCCDLLANALVPNAAKIVAPSPKGCGVIAVAPQFKEVLILLDLGEAAILTSVSPPTRAAPAQRSRAPPFA